MSEEQLNRNWRHRWGKTRDMRKIILTPAQIKRAEGYALDGCQNNTICTLMGWDDNFIDQRPDIRKLLTKKRAERKLKLYKAQNSKALTGNDTTMQIWLGKNVLDQADKNETKHSGEVTLAAPTIT